MIPKKETVEQIMRHLQGVLRIMDWTIEIDVLGAKEFSRQYGKDAELTRGDCTRDLKNHEASICLNADFVNEGKLNDAGEYWWYKTLVHELYHVCTARYDIYAQNAINHLESQSLIDNTHTNMDIECEGVVEGFAKIFVSIYPLGLVLDKLGLSWEDLK